MFFVYIVVECFFIFVEVNLLEWECDNYKKVMIEI